jgi:SpoVK/Ycf46/Vps4 family AAA+-type ATPase
MAAGRVAPRVKEVTMRDLADIERLIDSGTALIFVETADTTRLEELGGRLGVRTGRRAFRWALATGLTRLDGNGAPIRAAAKPADVLAQILATPDPGLYLLLDLARYLDDALIVSQLREIATRNRALKHSLLVPGASLEVPADLRSVATRVELALPTLEELEQLVREEAEAHGKQLGKRVQATQAAIRALTRNLAGLAHADARRLIRTAIADDGVLSDTDLPAVMDAKYRLLDQGGVLSFELNTAKMADVAGLANLKRWLGERKDVFLAETPTPGLDPPKGALLLGVQGGGKSLAAKSIAGAWGVPLLRLDFATLYNKYYGETERNLRESLRTAAVMAPCVLWIDEIEKGLASEGDDGGPGRRILGTLLVWMAERKEKVFLAATANDIESLPPELLRKGRFDEIFFVDLPGAEVRATIFEIHLKKRGQDTARFELKALAEAATGFSGAEIEQAVVSALYAANARKEALTTELIEGVIAGTRPLSVVMAEKVARLRAWAAERTVSAD